MQCDNTRRGIRVWYVRLQYQGRVVAAEVQEGPLVRLVEVRPGRERDLPR